MLAKSGVTGGTGRSRMDRRCSPFSSFCKYR